MENLQMDDLFSSVIKSTRTYVGKDPLLPWLQGINQIKNALPPDIANQKLPRFIDKCTRTFCNDKRYANDPRYLKLWIQLLEFVPSRGEVLSFMEQNKIGLKHALFYQAYALHYEKSRKYSEAESMYKLGIQRLAVPAESLQQSYDSFLQRMASRNRRKMRSVEARAAVSSANINLKCNGKNFIESSPGVCIIEEVENGRVRDPKGQFQSYGSSSLNCQPGSCNNVEKHCAPLYVTHEALGQPESSGECKNILKCSMSWSPESLIDESIVIYTGMSVDGENCDKDVIKNENLLSRGIYLVAGENGLKTEYGDSIKGKIGVNGIENLGRLARAFDLTSSLASKLCSEDISNAEKSVACALLSSNEVENACHHGLFESTINTKEIMADINHMFCQPLHGDQKASSQRDNRTKQAAEIFPILLDDDLEEQASMCQSLSFNVSKERNSSVSVPKGLQVFADENLICKSSNEVLKNSCSYEDLPPVKGLQILADENFDDFQQRDISRKKGSMSDICANSSLERINNHAQLDKGTAAISSSEFCSEDTIIIRKFVDSAIVGGTEEIEDACHHGLVEPTINTKEAMADINDMFGKPLHFDNLKRRRPLRTETIEQPAESFQIFADEDLEEGSKQQCILSNVFEEHDSVVAFDRDFHIFVDENILTRSSKEVPKKSCSFGLLAPVKGLQIFADESCEESQKTSIQCNIYKEDGPFSVPVEVDQDEQVREGKEYENACTSEEIKVLQVGEGAYPTTSLLCKICNEDTIIVRKFVDCAIAGNPKEVEDASHHGLVEPTINTKEAMAVINDMFGKPLHFGKLKTRSRPPKAENIEQSVECFQIFADELEEQCLREQNFLSGALERHGSAVPSIKDISVFVDENLVSNEIRKISYLTREFEPVQSLEALTEQRLKGNCQKANIKCNISTDEGLSGAPVHIFDDGKAIEDRKENKMNNTEGLKDHGLLGKDASPRASLPFEFPNEDTAIIHKFVDSAIVGATEAGDTHYHGLVEPTVNTKEAMADINDMFSKPLHLDKLNMRNSLSSTGTIKHPIESFQILPDEDLEEQGSSKQRPLSNTLDKR